MVSRFAVPAGVLSGGVLLGALLGTFANPVMKPAPEPAWAGMLQPQVAAGSASYGYTEALPEDLSPRDLPDGYAPAFAFSEVDDLWSPDFRMPAMAEWETRDVAALDVALEPREPADLAALADRSVAVPNYRAIEASAVQVDEVSEEPTAEPDLEDPAALAVPIDPASPPPLPAGQAKVIYVAGGPA